MSSYKFIVLFKEKFKLTDVLVSADGKWLSVAHNEKSVSCCYQSVFIYEVENSVLGFLGSLLAGFLISTLSQLWQLKLHSKYTVGLRMIQNNFGIKFLKMKIR